MSGHAGSFRHGSPWVAPPGSRAPPSVAGPSEQKAATVTGCHHCVLVASILSRALSFPLACCHVMRCSVERSMCRGTQGNWPPTAHEKLRPESNPASNHINEFRSGSFLVELETTKALRVTQSKKIQLICAWIHDPGKLWDSKCYFKSLTLG